MADMDIDCDGVQHGKGDDGRCGSSGDTRARRRPRIPLLRFDAFLHPYVVFGNVGSKGKFDPQSKDVEPLSLMAVVCGVKMNSWGMMTSADAAKFYGVWGDENGDDRPKAVIGEAAIPMVTFCSATA
ncbi:Endo-chitosanase [Lachnellula willkommii]|uniref:Endo-chitosanase n=1 Tax=Lachnellula willkommii TaxID=215461 RepID=A0A559MC57_9HELO|nr:Endo-chitosanase [Lachnellula willkommii]